MDICIGRMSSAVVKTFVCLQIFLGVSDAGQYCNYYISYGIYSYRYCATGCCGTVYSAYCCLDGYTADGGVIAGGVVGGLVLLACFIGFVVYSKKYSRGIVRPHNPVISVSSTSGKGMTIVRPAPQNVQYSYGQAQPQPYSQQPPPTYPPPPQPPTYPPPPQPGASAPYPPPSYIGSNPPSYTGPPTPLC